MAEVGSATVAIVPTFTGFRSKLSAEADGAGKESGNAFSSGFKGIVGPAIAAIGAIGFGSLVAEAARASDATDKFKATMNFAGLDTSAIDAATAAAKDFADQTVYDLPTIQNTIAQLASNGVKDYTGLTKAAGNLNAVAGGNADTFKSVAMVMTQTAGAGKLTTENWNQMADAIPGAAGPLMKSLEEAGAYTGNFRDAMAEGEITADEFNAALMKLGNDPIAVEAAKSTATFEGAIGNLEATINSGLMSALNALKPAITGAIGLLSGGLAKSFEFVGNAATGLVDLLWNGNFSGALRDAFNVEEDSGFVDFLFRVRESAIEVVGGFRAMFEAFKAGDGEVTSSGFAGVMEQIGNTARQVWEAIKPVGAALGTAFAGLAPQLAGILPLLSPLGLVFQALAPVLPQIASLIAGLAAQLGPVLGQVLAQVTPLIGMLVSTLSGVFVAIMPAVTAMVTTLSGALAQIIPVVMGVIAAVLPLVATLISQLAPIITNLVTSILPPVVSIFGNVVNAIGPLITVLMAALIPAIQALMPVVVTVFSFVADLIKNVMQAIQGVIQVVTGIITGNWEQVWTGIGNIFGAVWANIQTIVSGAIAIVGSLIAMGMSNVSRIVGGVLEGIGRFFADTWNNVTRGVGGFIDGLVGFFRDLPGKIMGTLSGIGTWLLDSGRSLIQGFIDGISGMVGAIGDAVGGVLEAAREFFPFSPAKRGPFSGRGYTSFSGQALARDFAGGINSQESLVAGAASRMMSAASGPLGLAAAAGSGGVFGGAGQVNNFTINQVDDPIGTSTAVARRLRRISV